MGKFSFFQSIIISLIAAIYNYRGILYLISYMFFIWLGMYVLNYFCLLVLKEYKKTIFYKKKNIK